MTKQQPTPLADTQAVSCSKYEREQELVGRARCGDIQARDEILLNLQSLLLHYALQAIRAFPTAVWFDQRDLVQTAFLAMLEKCAYALTLDNPHAYLTSVARGAIWDFCKAFRSLITTPRTIGTVPYVVESLDVPLSPESDSTLADVLLGEPLLLCADQAQQDSTALYQALTALSPMEHMVLTHHFGLHDQAPEPLHVINDTLFEGKKGSSLSYCKVHALMRLYHLLATVYPCYGGDMTHQERKTPAPDVPITEKQRQRLDQVCARLQAGGQKITTRRLCREAGVACRIASTYLRQRGLMQPGRKARLDQAYTRLQATGQDITFTRLSKEAHVAVDAAKLYLQQRLTHAKGKQFSERTPAQEVGMKYRPAVAQCEEMTP